MSLKKKFAAIVVAAATALSSVAFTAVAPLTSVTAFAAESDPFGSHAATIANGKEVQEQIKYVNTEDYADENNYKEFRFYCPGDGVMTLDLQAFINNTMIDVVRATDLGTVSNIKNTSVYHAGGYESYGYSNNYGYYWDSNKSVLSVTQKYDLTKGYYFIRIRRFFDTYADGTKGSGEIKLTCTMEKPNAIATAKTTKSTTSSVTLDWDDVSYGYNGGTAYYPTYAIGYREASSTGAYTQKTNKFSEITLTGLKPNTKYTVAIQTNVSGQMSAVKKFTVITKDYVAPPKVAKPTVSSITSSGAKLSWNKAVNSSRYLVRYKVYGSNDAATDKWVTASAAPSLTLSGLKPGTKYIAFVRGYNNTKAGAAWSDSVTFTTKGQVSLSAPTVQSSLTVHWNKVTSAAGYEVNYSLDSGKTWKTISTTATSQKFTSTSGKKIMFRVRATAGSVKGGYSATKTITLP